MTIPRLHFYWDQLISGSKASKEIPGYYAGYGEHLGVKAVLHFERCRINGEWAYTAWNFYSIRIFPRKHRPYNSSDKDRDPLMAALQKKYPELFRPRKERTKT